VLQVTGAARGRERRFVGMVRRRVVAAQAGVICNFLAENSRLRYVADLAALAKSCVRERKRTAAVDLLSGGALRREPSERCNWNQQRKPEPPSPERMRAREILQIDPLGQGLGCAYSSHG